MKLIYRAFYDFDQKQIKCIADKRENANLQTLLQLRWVRFTHQAG